METIALIGVAVLLGALLNRIYKKRKEKEAASKKEIENSEEKMLHSEETSVDALFFD